MLRQALANDLSLADDICAWCVGKWVAANEDVDTSLFEFLAGKKFVKFGAGARRRPCLVQLEISAVRRLFASPRGRKSLILADVSYHPPTAAETPLIGIQFDMAIKAV